MAFFKNLPLVLDGATGTEMQKAGMPISACTEKWILENPEPLLALQRAYAEAGSDVVCTPTFGANRANFKRHGLTLDVAETAMRLVGLSRSAVGDQCLLGGDIAPTGLMLEPYGETSAEECGEMFAEQASALDRAGVDFLFFETHVCLEEVRAAVSSARRVSRKPVAVSFTCDVTGHTLWGDDLKDALEALQDLGIDAFGVNCLDDLDALVAILRRLAPSARIPLIAKPNAGLPKLVDGAAVYSMSPEALAAFVPRLLEAGASLIGGCCGTTPAHIAAIRAAMLRI